MSHSFLMQSTALKLGGVKYLVRNTYLALQASHSIPVFSELLAVPVAGSLTHEFIAFFHSKDEFFTAFLPPHTPSWCFQGVSKDKQRLACSRMSIGFFISFTPLASR